MNKKHGLGLFASLSILLCEVAQIASGAIIVELPFSEPLKLSLVGSDLAYALLLAVLALLFLRAWSFKAATLIQMMFGISFALLNYLVEYLVSSLVFEPAWTNKLTSILLATAVSVGLYGVLRWGWQLVQRSLKKGSINS